MRLRPRTLVTLRNVPGVWVTGFYQGSGWWEITPKTSTPGLVALTSCGTLEAQRKDLVPLQQQERLL